MVTQSNVELLADRRFKGWEILLLALAILLLATAGLALFTDFPFLRLLLLQGQNISSSVSERIGALTTTAGKVKRQKESDSEFVVILPGTEVLSGDTIVTDSSAGAVITLNEGGKLELAPGTMVKLDFNSGISIGGIRRQTNVQLVSGAVGGETSREKIVVKTTTGKTTTLTSTKKAVIRQEVAAPMKVEPIAAPIAVEVVEATLPPPVVAPEEVVKPTEAPVSNAPAATPQPVPVILPTEVPTSTPTPSATPIASPTPSETPTPTPTTRIVAARISKLSPYSGETLKIPAGSTRPILPMTLSFESSKPEARFQVMLKKAGKLFGGVLLDQAVQPVNGVVSISSPIQAPGRYTWEIVDLDADTKLTSSQFSVSPTFETAGALPALIGDSVIDSNRTTGAILRDFPGLTLRWKPIASATEYELRVFEDAAKTKQLLEKNLEEPSFTFLEGTLPSKPLYYSVTARLASGFRAEIPNGKFEFKFLPPIPFEPAEGALLSLEKMNKQPAVLTWNYTSFTQSYQIEIARDAQFSSVIVRKSVQENFYPFTPKKAGTYYWRVRAQAPTFRSQPSPPRTFVVQ